MKDIFKILKEDHRKVKKLFNEYRELGEKAFKSKKALAETIIQELEVHTKIEEEYLYPVANKNLDHKGKKMVAEAYEEHNVAKSLIDQIKKTRPEDIEFDAKLKVLCENVEHHIEEEEEEFFPKVKRHLGEEVEKKLFDEMKQKKEELIAVCHH